MEKHIKVPMTREEAKQLKAGDYVYLTEQFIPRA